VLLDPGLVFAPHLHVLLVAHLMLLRRLNPTHFLKEPHVVSLHQLAKLTRVVAVVETSELCFLNLVLIVHLQHFFVTRNLPVISPRLFVKVVRRLAFPLRHHVVRMVQAYLRGFLP